MPSAARRGGGLCAAVAALLLIGSAPAQAATKWIIRPPVNSPNNVPVYAGLIPPASGVPFTTITARLVVPSAAFGGDFQQWVIARPPGVDLPPLTYVITGPAGLCLQTSLADLGSEYRRVFVGACHKTVAEAWQFYNTLGGAPRLVPAPSSPTNLYQIRNVVRGNVTCLTVPASSHFAVNTGLLANSCSAPLAVNQRWRVQSFVAP